MVDVGVWELIIVLFVVFLPVVGIATAGQVKQLQRASYALRVLGLLVFSFILSFVVEEFKGTAASDGIFVAALLISIVVALLWARWSAHRLNHLGRTRWWALLLLVPFVNLITIIVLCLVPGKAQAAVEADAGQ